MHPQSPPWRSHRTRHGRIKAPPLHPRHPSAYPVRCCAADDPWPWPSFYLDIRAFARPLSRCGSKARSSLSSTHRRPPPSPAPPRRIRFRLPTIRRRQLQVSSSNPSSPLPSGLCSAMIPPPTHQGPAPPACVPPLYSNPLFLLYPSPSHFPCPRARDEWGRLLPPPHRLAPVPTPMHDTNIHNSIFIYLLYYGHLTPTLMLYG